MPLQVRELTLYKLFCCHICWCVKDDYDKYHVNIYVNMWDVKGKQYKWEYIYLYLSQIILHSFPRLFWSNIVISFAINFQNIYNRKHHYCWVHASTNSSTNVFSFPSIQKTSSARNSQGNSIWLSVIYLFILFLQCETFEPISLFQQSTKFTI